MTHLLSYSTTPKDPDFKNMDIWGTCNIQLEVPTGMPKQSLSSLNRMTNYQGRL